MSDYTKIDFFDPKNLFTDKQSKSMHIDLEAQLGKRYKLGQALISAIDHLFPKFIKKRRAKELKTKGHFCSKLVAYAYKNLGLIDSIPRNLSPQELIDLLLEKDLITRAKNMGIIAILANLTKIVSLIEVIFIVFQKL